MSWCRNVFVSSAVTLLAASASAQDAPQAVVIGERAELQSRVLDETRLVLIGEPASYRRGEGSYPVLYLLDGGAHFHHATGITRFLSANDRIPELLVVAIANTDRSRDLTPPSQVRDEIETFPTQGGADGFLKFLTEELMPWVEQNYRTRPYRILVGHSLGGLFAIHTLITQPASFDAYVAISPSVQWNNRNLVSQADMFFGATAALEATLFMAIGDEGDALLGAMRQLADILREKTPAEFRWGFERMEKESHGSVPHLGIYYGMGAVFDGWYLSDAMTVFNESGIQALEAFYEESGRRFGYERRIPYGVFVELTARLIEANRLEEVAEITLRGPAAYPLPPQLLDRLAARYQANGDEIGAIEYFTTLLEAAPQNETARRVLSEIGVNERRE